MARAALWTGGEVDGEEAFESLAPAHAGLGGSCGGITRFIGWGRRRVGRAGHDLGPQRRVGGEHAIDGGADVGRGRPGVAGIPAGSSPAGSGPFHSFYKQVVS